jgi:hypothetical protein
LPNRIDPLSVNIKLIVGSHLDLPYFGYLLFFFL